MNKVKSKAKKPATVPPPAIQDSNFELELLWCIQSLENSLALGKMNQREAERVSKAIKTLKSPKEVFIKKRQLMSQLFGNYREKMEQEKKQFALDLNKMKIAPVEASKKSTFLKKATKSDANFVINNYIDQSGKSDENSSSHLKSDSNSSSIKDLSNAEQSQSSNSTCKAEIPEKFRYVPSGNTFRFNFEIENTADGEG